MLEPYTGHKPRKLTGEQKRLQAPSMYAVGCTCSSPMAQDILYCRLHALRQLLHPCVTTRSYLAMTWQVRHPCQCPGQAVDACCRTILPGKRTHVHFLRNITAGENAPIPPEALGYALSGIRSSSMSSLSDRKNDRQSTNFMRPLLWASTYP